MLWKLKHVYPEKLMKLRLRLVMKLKKGDVVLIMEAMKMKQPFAAPEDAVVKEIKVSVGERVSQGDVMVVLE